jgi:hypothetical protein
MFDENSFSIESFDTNSWWFDFIVSVKKKLKAIISMPKKYLVFPRFKIGG